MLLLIFKLGDILEPGTVICLDVDISVVVKWHILGFASIHSKSNLPNRRTFVNCGHLKKILTAPWLKNLVEYSYLLPKYSVKISREKKMGVFFLFHFL